MEKLKTGIIGCGKVGGIHAAALAGLKGSELTAVCDSDPARAREFGRTYGAKPYSEVGEMLAGANLDVVNVCTPHPLHRESAVMAAKAGVHVLVEKPLASSLEDCDAILDAARDGGVRLGTMSQRRYYEPARRVRQAIDEGKIGDPILGTVTVLGWRDQEYYQSDPWRGTWEGEGGGVLVNQAVHQLDLLQWFMGPVAELSGHWSNLSHPYIEVEDTATASIRFQSGGLGSIVASNSQNPVLFSHVHIHGSNGASLGVQTDGSATFIAGISEISEPAVLDMWTVPGDEEKWREWNEEDAAIFRSHEPTTYYHSLQIEDFLDAVVNDREPAVTGRDGRMSVEVFTAIFRSTRDRRAVSFPVEAETGRSDFDGRL